MTLLRREFRMRESGTYALEELVSDIDGSTAYQYSDAAVNKAISGSWQAAQTEVDPGIEWIVDDLDDGDLDTDISVSPALLAYLWSKAREYDRIMAVCVHVDRCVCE
jgi:hypothetical protein